MYGISIKNDGNQIIISDQYETLIEVKREIISNGTFLNYLYTAGVAFPELNPTLFGVDGFYDDDIMALVRPNTSNLAGTSIYPAKFTFPDGNVTNLYHSSTGSMEVVYLVRRPIINSTGVGLKLIHPDGGALFDSSRRGMHLVTYFDASSAGVSGTVSASTGNTVLPGKKRYLSHSLLTSGIWGASKLDLWTPTAYLPKFTFNTENSFSVTGQWYNGLPQPQYNGLFPASFVSYEVNWSGVVIDL